MEVSAVCSAEHFLSVKPASLSQAPGRGLGRRPGTREAGRLDGDGLRLQAGLPAVLVSAPQWAFVLPWLLLRVSTWLRAVSSDL